MINFEVPTVSVIIPVYNVSAFLPRCLDSLLNQTLSQIEILCVDDASTDGSVEIIKEYQKRDSRIKLLQQEHSGVSAARNLGIANAVGKYIAFIDGDDWVEKEMLQSMVIRARQTDSDMVICSARVHFKASGIGETRRLKSLQAALTVSEDVWSADRDSDRWSILEAPGCWPFIWNKLIRSDILKNNAVGFSKALALGEDGVFLQVLFQYVNRIAFVKDELYNYRYQRKGSATIKLYQDRVIRFEQHINVLDELLREFSSRSILLENKEQLLQWAIQFLYYDFVRLPAMGRRIISEKIKAVFEKHRLLSSDSSLNNIEKKRLQNLLRTDKDCSKVKRAYDIVRLKIENRIIKKLLGQ